MIIGGSRITRYLLKIIAPAGMDTCVIDHDRKMTEALAGDFPKVKVITGDGTDQSILEEQHLSDYDCFIALTGDRRGKSRHVAVRRQEKSPEAGDEGQPQTAS